MIGVFFLLERGEGWFSLMCQCRPQGQIAYTGLKIWFGTMLWLNGIGTNGTRNLRTEKKSRTDPFLV